MKKTYTCIVCPNGCEISAETEKGTQNYILSGALCKRGEAYVLQELRDPRRTFSTSVTVLGGEEDLVSVRLTTAIPLGKLMEAAEQIHRLKVQAPVHAGDVLMERVLDTDSSLIATRTVL